MDRTGDHDLNRLIFSHDIERHAEPPLDYDPLGAAAIDISSLFSELWLKGDSIRLEAVIEVDTKLQRGTYQPFTTLISAVDAPSCDIRWEPVQVPHGGG